MLDFRKIPLFSSRSPLIWATSDCIQMPHADDLIAGKQPAVYGQPFRACASTLGSWIKHVTTHFGDIWPIGFMGMVHIPTWIYDDIQYLSILPKYYVSFSSLIIQVFLRRKLCPSSCLSPWNESNAKNHPWNHQTWSDCYVFFERDLLWLPWTVWGTTKFQLIQTHVPQIKAPNVGSPFLVLNLDLNRTLLNARVGGLVGFNPLPQKSSQRSFRFLAKKQPPGMWKPPPQCHGHLPSTSTDWKFKPAFTTRPFPPFRLGPCHARMLETSTVLLEPFPFFGVSFQGISDFSLPHPW